MSDTTRSQPSPQEDEPFSFENATTHEANAIHNAYNAHDTYQTPPPGTLLHNYRTQQKRKQGQKPGSSDATIADTVRTDLSSPPPHSIINANNGERGRAKAVPTLSITQEAPQNQGWHWPAPQSWPSFGQKLITNTMLAMRDFSGKFSAIATSTNVEPEPLELYHPPILSSQSTQPRAKRWQRSRAVRTAILMRHRRKRWKKARPKKGRIWAGILISLFLILVILTSSSVSYAYGYYQSQLPLLQGLANQQVEQTTHIYDRNGLLLYDLYDTSAGGGRRTPVAYKYIPQVMQDAMIAAEDPTFWTNTGIDPTGIVRAAIQYSQAGSVQSGGSTITQQLIKQLTGNTQDTISRKIPEATLAVGLTQQYPKWKILEMYFNVTPFGAQDLGIEAAVEDYFHLQPQCDQKHNCIPGIYYLNCDAGHLNLCNPAHCNTSKYCNPLLGLARASLLAGLPQNPASYDPTLGTDAKNLALMRQDYVLQQMMSKQIEAGIAPITQATITQVEAMTAKMTFSGYKHVFYHGCQYFVTWVIAQLSAQLGTSLVDGGLNIYTTIDANLEAYVERAVYRHLYQPEYQPFLGTYGPLDSQYNVKDSAVVVMAAKTGEILAMDGGANWNSTDVETGGQNNLAVDPRQPGSAMKPIIYTTAFQQGWYPGIVLPDYKTYFPNGVSGQPIANAYTPSDYHANGQAPYTNTSPTVRTATADSRNVPAIKASYYAGINNVINTARRFGINVNLDTVDSFALGTNPIPLYQMVGAYQVFADNGVRVPPHIVLEVWDNYGHLLYHFNPAHPGGVQVISPQIAYMMTSILADENARAAEFVNDHVLAMWDWTLPDGTHPEVAAKTGTSDLFKDNLTIGYTPDVVVGTWSGNANDAPMQGVIGITGAAPIWHSIIERVMGACNLDGAGIPCGNFNFHFSDRTFPQPSGLVQQCVSSANGLGFSGTNCDWMLPSDVPQQSGIVTGK